ncbi:hypothetical protein M406DRAFT_358523 [Cryphonectria parasitica EP155]|uniref:Uncharacterized protein n=1 Tax=Cryphonectria parasitica (strain ATCC 38755 / EP155) TaxID=660469 RepID=A0A9P5CJQ9_CRYP1|nr:uncharacterized protein M406DRAFT_358523 [Cryphonectria parasitica EP155]KAF3760176.1 hypothetical protein M406DRAFT_358523 [Cryphonectria parasitica EP155]
MIKVLCLMTLRGQETWGYEGTTRKSLMILCFKWTTQSQLPPKETGYDLIMARVFSGASLFTCYPFFCYFVICLRRGFDGSWHDLGQGSIAMAPHG